MSEFNNKLFQYIELPNNLFALLSRYRVSVPGIQRHYVQGANNPKAEEVRQVFIAKLLGSAETNEEIHLHFIYGPIDTNGEDSFTPVDGQQRLTTLWLLARYAIEHIQQTSQKEALLKLLSKFSYSDRIHASRFCKAFTEQENSWDISEDPQESIIRQEWFWDYWKEDETVASMLRMLTTIHGIWAKKQLTYDNILQFLVDKVTFTLQIDAFGDDIYMKMNARGLQLTQWENFKGRFADLLSKETITDTDTQNTLIKTYINHYKQLYKLTDFNYSIKEIWETEIERLSNLYFDYTNNKLPDNPFFALFGRLAMYNLNRIIEDYSNKIERDSEPGEQIIQIKGYIRNIENLSNTNGSNWTEIELPYVPFDEFKFVFFNYDMDKDKFVHDEKSRQYIPRSNSNINDFAIKSLILIECVLGCRSQITPYWEKGQELINTFFCPRNLRDCDFSLCCFEYFSKYPYAAKEAFEDACRYMWNILENVTDDHLKYIKNQIELGDNTLYPQNEKTISLELSRLKNISKTPKQLIEELEKAKQIHFPQADTTLSSNELNWKEIIHKAENFAFFKGSIRFLYYSSTIEVDWSHSNFILKWDNAKTYFDDNNNYKSSMKELMKYVPIDIWCKKYSVDWKSESQWKRFLIDNNLKTEIDLFLRKESSNLTNYRQIKELITFFDYINNDSNKGAYWLLKDFNRFKYVYTCYTNKVNDEEAAVDLVYPIAPERNDLLNDCESKNLIHVDDKYKVKQDGVYIYKGFLLKFTYKEKRFIWYQRNNDEYDVYLWENKEYSVKNANSSSDHEKYYCFNIDEKENTTGFIKKLEELITEVSQHTIRIKDDTT